MTEEFNSPEGEQPFVFRMPYQPGETTSIDLKWLTEEFEKTDQLLHDFWQSYQKLVQQKSHPTALLKKHFAVIGALAEYQISLSDQSLRRQGHIENEAEVQEIMNQLEGFMKTFRDR